MPYPKGLIVDNPSRNELLKIAEARLHPSLTEPNFLVLRSRRLQFTEWIAQLPPNGLRVLDVGGRYQPYRPLLQDKTDIYVGLDILRTEMVDVVASGEALPFAANSFDLVIATGVFEYFSQPHFAAEQIRGVLRPGGSLLMSVACFAPRIVSEEKWRFTEAGLRVTFSGFSKIEIVAETYSAAGLFRSINLGLLAVSHFRLLRSLTQFSLVPALNLFGLWLEKIRFTTNDQFAPNYSVLAVK